MDKIIPMLWMVFAFVFWFLLIKKLIWNRYSSIKTVKAEVFDKYVADAATKYPGTFNRKRYVVVFKTKDTKLSFDVSEFSYNNYRIKDKGTLSYKGKRIISFE